MPIASFSSFTDGLERDQRSRDHFITNINLEDDRLWIPYADGVWFQPCHFNVTTGGFSVVLKGLAGSRIGTHYHVGTVHGYTLRGHWRYLEHEWICETWDFHLRASWRGPHAGDRRRLTGTDGDSLRSWRRLNLFG